MFPSIGVASYGALGHVPPAPSTSNCLIFQVTSEPHKLWHSTPGGCLSSKNYSLSFVPPRIKSWRLHCSPPTTIFCHWLLRRWLVKTKDKRYQNRYIPSPSFSMLFSAPWMFVTGSGHSMLCWCKVLIIACSPSEFTLQSHIIQWPHASDIYPVPGRGTGYCFRAISFILSFFVSLSATLRENGWTDLHEIFREGVQWPWDDLIKFWINLGKRVGGSKVNLFVITGHSSEDWR